MHTRTHTADNSPGAGRRSYAPCMGIVTAVDDPRKLARVKFRAPGLGGQLELAWARVVVPFAGSQTGMFALPEVGAGVYIAFEDGDENRPIVLGAIWFQQGEKSTLPLAVRGEDDPVRVGRGEDTASGANGRTITEPEDPWGPPEYPHNQVWKSPAGHLFEFDNTDGKERIGITHGPSKTWLEIHPDGTLVLGIKAKRYTIVEEDDAKHVKGDEDVVVDGDATHSAGKTFARQCDGYSAFSTKKWEVDAIGKARLRASEIELQAPGTTKLGPGVAPGQVVTTLTHPTDYITGLPIVGVPLVQAG